VIGLPTCIGFSVRWVGPSWRWSGGRCGGRPGDAGNSVVHAFCHGHVLGRCRIRRRAELAIRVGTVTSVDRSGVGSGAGVTLADRVQHGSRTGGGVLKRCGACSHR
jgi:hypothetical protein